MIAFGILQGRLSPAPAGRPQAFPRTTWAAEFAHAQAIGFDGIEWLVTADRVGENPILTDGGIADILGESRRTGVRVTSVLADCFIQLPIVGAADGDRVDRLALLGRIVRQAAELDVPVVVLPLLEANEPRSDAEIAAVWRAMAPSLALAADLDVQVALETAWPGERLHTFIRSCGATALRACYDIGNAAALGLTAARDLRALGPVLADVHVKDRRRTGESVPLGEGDADLAGAFAVLDAIGYSGTAVLETPVGGHPIDSAARNLAAARALQPRRVPA